MCMQFANALEGTKAVGVFLFTLLCYYKKLLKEQMSEKLEFANTVIKTVYAYVVENKTIPNSSKLEAMSFANFVSTPDITSATH